MNNRENQDFFNQHELLIRSPFFSQITEEIYRITDLLTLNKINEDQAVEDLHEYLIGSGFTDRSIMIDARVGFDSEVSEDMLVDFGTEYHDGKRPYYIATELEVKCPDEDPLGWDENEEVFYFNFTTQTKDGYDIDMRVYIEDLYNLSFEETPVIDRTEYIKYYLPEVFRKVESINPNSNSTPSLGRVLNSLKTFTITKNQYVFLSEQGLDIEPIILSKAGIEEYQVYNIDTYDDSGDVTSSTNFENVNIVNLSWIEDTSNPELMRLALKLKASDREFHKESDLEIVPLESLYSLRLIETKHERFGRTALSSIATDSVDVKGDYALDAWKEEMVDIRLLSYNEGGYYQISVTDEIESLCVATNDYVGLDAQMKLTDEEKVGLRWNLLDILQKMDRVRIGDTLELSGKDLVAISEDSEEYCELLEQPIRGKLKDIQILAVSFSEDGGTTYVDDNSYSVGLELDDVYAVCQNGELVRILGRKKWVVSLSGKFKASKLFYQEDFDSSKITGL